VRPGVINLIAVLGCGASVATPVAVGQEQNRDTDCAAVAAEIEANKAKLAELEKGGFLESKNSDYVVAATGVVGAVVLLGYYGMVQKPGKDSEIATIQERQRELAALTEQRCRPVNAPDLKKTSKPRRR
jgi:hypothetical protein